MSGAEQILAINIDPQAPIFKAAHAALVGDVCEIIPALLNKIENGASHV
jgi:electron transfer flavoprotein alpha subunit